MKTRHALTMIACLGLSSLGARAAEVSPARSALTIPVNVANRPVGSVQCTVEAGPTVPVVALAFSPDGKTLAVGGYREVLLWDLSGAKLARRLPAGGCVGSVVFLKDGQTLAVGEGTPGESGAVQLLDVSAGDEICRLSEPKDVVSVLTLSPDGKLLAGSGAGRLAYVWDVEQKKLAATIKGHSDRILHICFSPSGKFMMTAGDDDTSQIWNVADWSAAAKFTEPYPVHGGAFNPDETQVLLAVGSADASSLRMRKTDDPMSRRQYGLGAALPLGMIGPSKAGRVYVPCTDKTVRVYDVRNGSLLATLIGHQDWVQAVALSPDQTQIASGSADGTVKLWSNADGHLLATLVQLSPRSDKWLILTAQGYFTASSPSALSWSAIKLLTLPEQVNAKLQSSELVSKTIAGGKVPAPALK